MAIPFTLPLQSQVTDENRLASSENIDAAINSIDLTEYLKNSATGSESLTIAGTASSYNMSLNVGPSSSITGDHGTAVGYGTTATNDGTALGFNAKAQATYAIQLGYGTNSTPNTFSVGLSDSVNVQLLDANGQIPAERLTNTLGDIETLLAAL